MRQFMVLAGLAVLVLVLGLTIFDEGEVVMLTTVDELGHSHETPVWIVETDEGIYLRAGRREASWLARIADHPEVEIEGGGQAGSYLAEPSDDPALRESINRAMAEKYGAADLFVGTLLDRGEAVPIRIEPIPD